MTGTRDDVTATAAVLGDLLPLNDARATLITRDRSGIAFILGQEKEEKNYPPTDVWASVAGVRLANMYDDRERDDDAVVFARVEFDMNGLTVSERRQVLREFVAHLRHPRIQPPCARARATRSNPDRWPSQYAIRWLVFEKDIEDAASPIVADAAGVPKTGKTSSATGARRRGRDGHRSLQT